MKFTKPEVVGVVFSKLRPNKEKTFADIGCGSGTVIEFFAPYVKKAYAVDCDIKAINSARDKLSRFDNVEVIHSDGLSFLKSHTVDLVFFGGTRGIERMLEVCEAERIVVNAARLEIAVLVAKKMRDIGIFREILIMNIAKSYDLAGGTAFKPINPVFVVFGEREY